MKTNPFHRFTTLDISRLADRTPAELAECIAGSASGEHIRHRHALTIALHNIAIGSALTTDTPSTAAFLHEVFRNFEAKDPSVGQYNSMGFVSPDATYVDDLTGEVQLCVPIQGKTAVVLRLQLRERILPAKIVSEKLQERVAEFEKREGRPANKKDWAVLRDETKAAMLKTALVRRTDIPVILGQGYCHVFSSSPSKVENVCAYLRTVFGTWPVLPVFGSAAAFHQWMTNVTRVNMASDLDKEHFLPMQYAKMEDGQDDSVITVKNEPTRDANGYTVNELLSRGYYPTEMDMRHCRLGVTEDEDVEGELRSASDDWDMGIRINDKGVVKKFSFGDISAEREPADAETMVTKHWLVYNAVMSLLADLRNAGVMITDEDRKDIEPEDTATVDMVLVQGGTVFAKQEQAEEEDDVLGLADDDIDSAMADEEDDEL